MSILDDIIANKKEEIGVCRANWPVDALRELAKDREAPPEFVASLAAMPMGLIAEVKRRSPSAGLIRDPFDPFAIARAYADAGAQAISVLMDRKFFGGGEDDFRTVRSAVPLPLLYKEFVVDEWQIWHAASLGASAVLLIAAVLETRAIAKLLDICREARLEALVETHDEEDMSKLAGMPIRCVGVNNRDLRTFSVALETTLRLRELAPEGALLVSESGIGTAEDVRRLRDGGVNALLVGESLLRKPDPGAAVRELMKGVWAETNEH